MLRLIFLQEEHKMSNQNGAAQLRYFYSSNNTVMVHIRNLRRKLGDDPQNSHIIQTVWGKGYRIG